MQPLHVALVLMHVIVGWGIVINAVYGRLILQVAQLVTDLLKGLPKDVLSQLTVICSSEDAAQALQQRQQHAKHTFRAISLGEAFLESMSALLIIVGASKDEVSPRAS